VGMALMYARVIHQRKPNPLSDPAFATLVFVVLTTTVYKRDLVGILWAPALMLMMHLVSRRSVSLAFDAAVLVMAAAHCVVNHDMDTTFRVMVILLITSAFAHIYAQNVEGHHRVLDEQRQHLDLMVRCAAVGGMEWAADDGFGAPSSRLADWMGLPPDNPEGLRTRLVEHLAPEHRPELTRMLGQLTAGTTEPHGSRHAPPQDLRLVRPDGSDVWLHAEFMALSNAEGKPAKVVATFIDISRLRAAEADTLAALKRQQELNELRARFVAMTSHEFRTPLAAILSSAELLQHYGERLPDNEKQAVLKGIHDGVHRMTHMLDRILLINKADAQMLECRPQPVGLASSIRQIADELETDGAGIQRRIQIRVNPPEAHPRVDPKLLHHILGNLMSNALKYSPGHKPVWVTADLNGPDVRLVVEDQGIGIPAQDLPELFEPFHRGGNVGELQGTGLGLTIVKKSAELHGGRVDVSSQPDQGTRFTVFLRQGAPA
jgi:signal transduction histidine kinase